MFFTLPSLQISAKDVDAIINFLDKTFVKPIENAFSSSKSEQSSEPKESEPEESEPSPINNIPFFTGQRTVKGKTFFRGTVGDDKIVGSTSHNLINGMEGNDTIKAGAGDDIVYGEQGDDVLYGGKGDDIINGGEGNDTLIGGSGADTFFVNKGMNVIQDFNKDEGDTLKFGRYLSDVSYEQDGQNVLVKSDQGVTTILNHDVSDFIS